MNLFKLLLGKNDPPQPKPYPKPDPEEYLTLEFEYRFPGEPWKKCTEPPPPRVEKKYTFTSALSCPDGHTVSLDDPPRDMVCPVCGGFVEKSIAKRFLRVHPETRVVRSTSLMCHSSWESDHYEFVRWFPKPEKETYV